MGLNQIILEGLAAIVIVIRRLFLLLFYPYSTMRAIAKDKDLWQLGVIFSTVFAYYLAVDKVKDITYSPLTQFGLVVFNFILTVGYIALFSYIYHKKIEWRRTLVLFGYALLPTVVWFYVNTFLYVAIPPPRHLTLLGKLFSISFITLSVSLLAWKIILMYLAVRYSTRLQFYDIVFLMMVYVALVVPYSFLLYNFGFFRIPFI